MKFPSVSQLWQSFLAVCKRFAIAISYTLIATIAGLVLSYNWKDFAIEQLLVKLIYLGNFGLVLSLSLSLYAESHPLNFQKKSLANLLILSVLALIYFTLQPANYQADVFVLLALGFAFHLLVAFSAFHSKENEVGFWQINKTFFLRFATSALYSGVLFAGLSIALFSTHTLFNIHWDGEIYFRLWIIIAGLFNTIFFLAGIPQPISSLNHEEIYPKALKVFTQYVLIPLASIYLLILLAYEVKIILAWSLPNSSVSILILGYAVFGMLSILLIHPIRNQEGNKWIQLYSKSFYLLMLPLLVLLAVAIVKRVADYGITESRYLLIVLSLWLSFITVYFLIKGREHIRVIPISLFVFAVLIAVGPWSIKSVSRDSQSKRLAQYISQKVSVERNDEIRNLVNYLNIHYGSKTLQPFVNINLQSIEQKNAAIAKKKKLSRWELQGRVTDTVLASLKVGDIATAQLLNNQQKSYINADRDILDVKGALKVVVINSNLAKEITFSVGNQRFLLRVDDASNLVVSDAKKANVFFIINDILKRLLNDKSLKADKNGTNSLVVPAGALTIEQPFDNYTFKLRLEEINGFYPGKKQSKPTSIYYSGYLIIYLNL